MWELDPDDPENNGFQNEDLIVWMRTAALPTFRKLYRRIDHSVEGYKNGLPKGNYTLLVKYSKYDWFYFVNDYISTILNFFNMSSVSLSSFYQTIK